MNVLRDSYKLKGTTRQGHVIASRLQLERVFGKPSFTASDPLSDSTVEWWIEFEDGSVATIYDHNRRAEKWDEAEEIRWEVGGDKWVTLKVREFLNN